MDGLTGVGELSSAIQPQYATFSAVSNQFRRMRTVEFTTGHLRPPPDISIPSRYVPKTVGPKLSVDLQQKEMAGMGEFVVDPMQNFGSEKLQLEGRSYRTRQSRPQPRSEGNRFRGKGIAAYNRESR